MDPINDNVKEKEIGLIEKNVIKSISSKPNLYIDSPDLINENIIDAEFSCKDKKGLLGARSNDLMSNTIGQEFINSVNTDKFRPFYIKVGDASISFSPRKTGTLLLFDIDDTLYEGGSDFWGIWFEQLKGILTSKNMTYSMADYYRYDKKYGFAEKGYFIENLLTYSDYSEKLLPCMPFETMIAKNTALKEYLMSLPFEKWCFTNACQIHAKRALQAIGIEECFSAIIHCDYINHIPLHKPMREAFEFVETLWGSKQIIFFDDNIKNVKMAGKMGWRVIKIESGDSVINKIRNVLDNLDSMGI